MKKLSLERVRFLPKELAAGILYVSEEYAVAGHLCACGCGNKVVVPLGQAEWTFYERSGLPTLRPSIGNWQLPCQSHYLITNGAIDWAGRWSAQQIVAGRVVEEQRRQAYYKGLEKKGCWTWLWNAAKRLFGR